MDLKDNFTNRYFNNSLSRTNYTDSLNSNVNLINQPTGLDAMAEGFTASGAGQAKNAGERLNNITLSGIGSGLKAAANNKRQDQLSPLLEQAGQINAQAAYLESQMQETEQENTDRVSFVQKQSYALSELAKATSANDISASNEIAKGILASYKTSSQDPTVGDFDHFNNGTVYYVNNETGEKSGFSIPQLIAQSGVPSEQLWGDDAPFVMSAFSPGFKEQYTNTQAQQQFQQEVGEAKLADTRAHTGLLESQAGQIQGNIDNPKMSEQGALEFKTNLESNNKHLDNLQKTITEKSIPQKILVLNRLEDILKQEDSAGGTPLKALQRWGKKISGKDEILKEAEMLQKYFFVDIKGVAGNPNQQEWSDLVSKIVSTSQNVDSALNVIAFERKQAQLLLDNYDDLSHVISDNNNQFSHHHPEIKNQVKHRASNRESDKSNSKEVTSKKDVENLIQWD